MTSYLLDTNIISDLVRNPHGRVMEKIAQFGEDAVCTSIIVACELRYGAQKRGSTRLTKQLDSILNAMTVLPLANDTDHHYGTIRRNLEEAGTPIGANDLLIAAHAMTLSQTLVTANMREFERVEGLRLENWLA